MTLTPEQIREEKEMSDHNEPTGHACPSCGQIYARENIIEANAAEIERLRAALQYCGGRLDHPRCPRCADRQQVARAALKEEGK